MQAILLSSEEVARRANQLYDSEIRQKVETEGNIGKMVIIDIETGDYEVDETGIQAAQNLYAKHPFARLFGIRIGYNVAASLGGVMERVSSDFGIVTDRHAIATGRRTLIGTALLNEQELVIQFTEGGLVTINEL